MAGCGPGPAQKQGGGRGTSPTLRRLVLPPGSPHPGLAPALGAVIYLNCLLLYFQVADLSLPSLWEPREMYRPQEAQTDRGRVFVLMC